MMVEDGPRRRREVELSAAREVTLRARLPPPASDNLASRHPFRNLNVKHGQLVISPVIYVIYEYFTSHPCRYLIKSVYLSLIPDRFPLTLSHPGPR